MNQYVSSSFSEYRSTEKTHKIILPEQNLAHINGMVSIYVLWTDGEGIRYVGKTIYPSKRFKEHLVDRRGNRYCSKWVQKKKLENIEIKMNIIEICEEKNWEERERFWIKKYREDNCKLTNISDGGDGTVGFKHTEENKKKMSEISKERLKKRPDLLDMLRKNGEKTGGRKHTEETKRKISKIKKQYYKENPDKIDKLQEGLKQNWFGTERQKEYYKNRKVTHDEENRKKISSSLKEYYKNNPQKIKETTKKRELTIENNPTLKKKRIESARKGNRERQKRMNNRRWIPFFGLFYCGEMMFLWE